MRVTFVVPGSIDARTGGSIYDRRMVDGLRRADCQVDVRELGDGFPQPSPSVLEHAGSVFAAIGDGSVVVVDGLAFSAMPEIVERHQHRLRLVALVHLPLSADVTLDAKSRPAIESAERRTLAAATRVVVTGEASIALLDRYSLPRERIVIIEPGTERASLSSGSDGSTLEILSVGTLGPGKGHDVLLAALNAVEQRGWHLTCAGSATRFPATVERLRDMVNRYGFSSRVTLAGELTADALDDCYHRADLFALATLQETYGMAVAEALAHGLPVVSTNTGAIPALVGDGAGLLVQPGSEIELAAALGRVLGDRSLLARFRAGARKVREHLPTWDDAVQKMKAALEPLAAHAANG